MSERDQIVTSVRVTVQFTWADVIQALTMHLIFGEHCSHRTFTRDWVDRALRSYAHDWGTEGECSRRGDARLLDESWERTFEPRLREVYPELCPAQVPRENWTGDTTTVGKGRDGVPRPNRIVGSA